MRSMGPGFQTFLAVPFTSVDKIDSEILLPRLRDQNDNAGPLRFTRSTVTCSLDHLIKSTLPSAPGTDIGNNLNCPACRNLRRSGAALVGARWCAEILSGGDHFQKDALRRFRVAGSITAPVASNILPKAVRSASRAC